MLYGDQIKYGLCIENVIKWSRWDEQYIYNYEFGYHGTVTEFSDSPVYYNDLFKKDN